MRASLFHTHSIGGSTVGYARIQMLSAGAYRFAGQYLLSVQYSFIEKFTNRNLKIGLQKY